MKAVLCSSTHRPFHVVLQVGAAATVGLAYLHKLQSALRYTLYREAAFSQTTLIVLHGCLHHTNTDSHHHENPRAFQHFRYHLSRQHSVACCVCIALGSSSRGAQHRACFFAYCTAAADMEVHHARQQPESVSQAVAVQLLLILHSLQAVYCHQSCHEQLSLFASTLEQPCHQAVLC